MKRTKDGRIIEKRVKIDKKYFKKIILEIKSKKKITWKQLSKKFNIGEHTLRVDWMKKERTIPLPIFKKIIDSHPKIKFKNTKNKIEILNPFWGQNVGDKNSKKISFPEINSNKFAEFFGIMLGDGCIYSNLRVICIAGHKILERDYYQKYINKLIKDLFSISPKFCISNKTNSIRCYVNSKKICLFLNDMGFPKGRKIKTEILSRFNEKEISYCIRGIFDTDGSLSAHPHSKIMIHLSIPQKTLRKSVINSLQKLKIKFSKSKKGIFIYGDKKVSKFMEKIGSSNYKNKYKYDIFKKTRKVPTSKETERFLINQYN